MKRWPTKPKFRKLKPQIPPISQIFEEVIGDERANLFVVKLQGIDNRNLLYLCHLLCNLRVNPFRFLGLIAYRESSVICCCEPVDL